jgi:hypothetical protein
MRTLENLITIGIELRLAHWATTILTMLGRGQINQPAGQRSVCIQDVLVILVYLGKPPDEIE